jgi:excisionase family DNA binding protein
LGNETSSQSRYGLPDLVSVNTAAYLTGESSGVIYRWIRDCGMPHYRFGGAIRVDMDDLVKWVLAQRVDGQSAHSPDEAQIEMASTRPRTYDSTRAKRLVERTRGF